MAKNFTYASQFTVVGNTDGIVQPTIYNVKAGEDSIAYPTLEENPHSRYVTQTHRVLRVYGTLNKHIRAYPGYPIRSVVPEKFDAVVSGGPNGSLHLSTWKTDSVSDYALLRAECINKALNKGYDQGRMQGGVFFAELSQVRKMILSRSTSMAKHLISATSGTTWRNLKNEINIVRAGGARVNRKRFNRLQKDIANNWLEFSYGWKPLVSDIKSGSEFIASLALKENEFKVRQKIVREFPSTYTVVTPSFKVKSSAKWAGNVKMILKCTLHLDYERSQDYQNFAEYLNGAYLRRAGLSIEQWPSIVWELIPYSFLVDYVANLGDMIRYTFDPLPISSATLSTRIEFPEGSYSGKFTGAGVNNTTASYTGDLEMVPMYNKPCFRYQREVLPTTGLGTVMLNRDSSLLHALNVTSLLWQKGLSKS